MNSQFSFRNHQPVRWVNHEDEANAVTANLPEAFAFPGMDGTISSKFNTRTTNMRLDLGWFGRL